MTNHVTSTTGHDQSGQLPTLHAEESPGPACHAVAEDSAAHNETGALLWMCPVCGGAWPLVASGERGAMARSACARVNRRMSARTQRLAHDRDQDHARSRTASV